MNLIPKIAQMLGVEIGEEFEANGKTVRFTDKGLFRYNNDGFGKEWWSGAELTLIGLINGSYEVKKPPFEPKEGERYWYVYWNESGNIDTTNTGWDAEVSNWEDKYCGNCFRTEAEAEREKYNVYERLTGKKWEEK